MAGEGLDLKKVWEEELEYLEQNGLFEEAIMAVLEELQGQGWEIIYINKDDLKEVYTTLSDLTFEDRAGKIIILY